MIFASFFDPANDGVDIGDIAVIAAVFFGPAVIVLGWIRIWGKKWMRSVVRPIVIEVVDERTKSIQRDANGGRSLPDANKKIDLIAQHLGIALPESLQAKD